MNAPPGPLHNQDVNRTHEEMRSKPPRRRERLLARARAARKRLAKSS
jgi:hypothetical protein